MNADVPNVVAECESICLGKPYMAIQAGHHCFCGDSLAALGEEPYTIVKNSECNSHVGPACPQRHFCGGPFRNSVFRLYKRSAEAEDLQLGMSGGCTLATTFGPTTEQTLPLGFGVRNGDGRCLTMSTPSNQTVAQSAKACTGGEDQSFTAILASSLEVPSTWQNLESEKIILLSQRDESKVFFREGAKLVEPQFTWQTTGELSFDATGVFGLGGGPRYLIADGKEAGRFQWENMSSMRIFIYCHFASTSLGQGLLESPVCLV